MYIELHESNSFVLEVLKAHQVSIGQDIKCLEKCFRLQFYCTVL